MCCHPEKKVIAKGLCGACYAKQRRQNPEVKARVYAINKRWIEQNPDYSRARSKRRWQNSSDEIKDYSKRWFAKNPEKRRIYKRNWQQKNQEKYLTQMRADVKKRKALKRGATISDFSAKQWTQVKTIYNHECFYCQSSNCKLEVDHIIPLSKGGNHTATNIVPACSICNNKKSNKDIKDFIKTLDPKTMNNDLLLFLQGAPSENNPHQVLLVCR